MTKFQTPTKIFERTVQLDNTGEFEPETGDDFREMEEWLNIH